MNQKKIYNFHSTTRPKLGCGGSGSVASPTFLTSKRESAFAALLELFRLHIDGLTTEEAAKLLLVHYRIKLSKAGVTRALNTMNERHIAMLEAQDLTPRYLFVKRSLPNNTERWLLYHYAGA